MLNLLDVRNTSHDYKNRPKPEPTVWGTCIGAWGDCIIDLGIAKNFLGEGFGIINYSKDPDIQKFINAQPFVHDCIWVEPKDEREYKKLYWKMVSTPEYVKDPIHEIVERSGVDHKKVVLTSISERRIKSRVAYPWHGAILPSSANEIAYDTRFAVSEDYYVLFPYSFQSSGVTDHWEHWQDAVQWLLRYTPHTYILCGTGYNVQGEHPRLINLVGKTDSMLEVFALAQMSKGVITTSSGLSHFCNVQHIPQVVVGNKPLSDYNSYFVHYYNRDILVMYEQGLDIFIQTASRLIK